jgi:putative transposase
MSQPRQIPSRATYLITRRVLRRHMLLRPDDAITQILVYVLAVSTRLYGIEVHAFCAMSTHLHLVVTDVRGVLPRFLQFFHRIVALCTKVLRKWEGPVWDHEATSVVQLLTPVSVVEKIAYVLANPVAAGLVQHAREWPGAKVDAGEIGRGELQAKRPAVYLDATNPGWPEEVALPLMLPPDIDQDSAESFRREVAVELERQEAAARAEVERQGLRFLGAARASQVSPYERATSFEALRDRNPTFAVGCGQGGHGVPPPVPCARFAPRSNDGAPVCARPCSRRGRGGCPRSTAPA